MTSCWLVSNVSQQAATINVISAKGSDSAFMIVDPSRIIIRSVRVERLLNLRHRARFQEHQREKDSRFLGIQLI